MRENSDPHQAHEEPGPPNADTGADAHATADFTGPGNVPPPAAGNAAAELPAARRRTWTIWLLAGAMALVAGMSATAIVRKLQADHALSRVARVAVVPGNVAARDFPEAGSTGTTADASSTGTTADASTTAGTAPQAVTRTAPAPDAEDAAPSLVAGAAGAAGAAGTAALLAQGATANAGRPDVTAGPGQAAAAASADRMGQADAAAGKPHAVAATNGVQALQPVPPAPASAEEGAGSRVANTEPARSAATKRADARNKVAKSGVAKGSSTRRANQRANKRAADAGDTFKRCPPLGRKGAVMCRWHICNGAAGKEAACRPYLERAP